MDTILQQKIIEATHCVEKQLDTEIEKLDNLDINDFEKLREQRFQKLKLLQQQKQNWLSLGHGEYSELQDEKEFFEISKKSENIVCLFYKDDSPRCKIVDHHFKILAKKHIEARFCKLNVMRCPFLTKRLRIKIIPTIALIVNGKTKDYIVGFTDLGNRDDFLTETLEYRISLSGVIIFEKNFSSEDNKKSWLSHITKPKTIKGSNNSNSEDSDEN
ncbi:Thioredoxin domain-containing protein 9 [Eufriesea mexicana]|uniref:thioredoxin domain-containing protein 9-like n=1 Tax=Eufriesea mexicana TaxID=516756 RepID=UPI00083C39F4|nr:PREDICTED: thioredoxin domain-containing protein 9-like [Eufriesea mexicana]XP_017759575.1 PREDICTED: thioredoxin domain-containing protein 9-like [Eufriesea mexicana]OAD55563.1 Thioredoxin domain-containing protein 9 [Eufriesea mexicana]OAD55564.1 Thioredoxin domain-containing protein 9 [Eufriesea mexicana]